MSGTPEKLTKELKFRCTLSMFTKVSALCKVSKWKSADILRTGFEMHWPDIEAHVLVQSGKQVILTPEIRRAIADLQRLGGDPVLALKNAARMHLATLPDIPR